MLGKKDNDHYYEGNKIYEYIKKGPYDKQFFWAAKNLWLLVYGNKEDCMPKLLLVVAEDKNTNIITTKEVEALKVAYEISRCHNHLPVAMLKYDPGTQPLKDVMFITSPKSHKGKRIKIENLLGVFEEYGLNVSSSVSSKSINDAPSSTYHQWQKEFLGDDIIATDIDLIKNPFDNENRKLFELKRSCKALKTWTPYPDDFNNYLMLANLLPDGEKLTVVYNVYTKPESGERIDDISTVKIYSFEKHSEEFDLVGYQAIDDFIAGNQSYLPKRC